jgi:6-phosphogluconolactonase
MRFHYYHDESTMNRELAERITALAHECIAQKKQFSLVLSGGNTPRNLYTLLRDIKTDWSHWHIYFGDERCLPANTEGRNDKMAFDAWLSHVAVPAAQIHSIPSELPQPEAVTQYTDNIKNTAQFDLVLLGIGEDGHTASLFPNNDWGTEKNAASVLAVSNAPFAPAQRITLSARRLSQTRHLWYLVSGAKKQNALLRWQQGAHLPMTVITPPNGVDVFVAQA